MSLECECSGGGRAGPFFTCSYFLVLSSCVLRLKMQGLSSCVVLSSCAQAENAGKEPARSRRPRCLAPCSCGNSTAKMAWQVLLQCCCHEEAQRTDFRMVNSPLLLLT